jgi:hypothetical protein
MCEHLEMLEQELKRRNIKETYRGQAWSKNCREWVYYDCYFDIEQLRKRFNFPYFIKYHSNDDVKSGLEEGFVCELCNDTIMGLHSKFKSNDNKIMIK